MRLETDHPQWYDGIFDAQGLLFVRMAFTRGGRTKPEQFALFEKLGLLTPEHGTVRELAERLGARVPFLGPSSALLSELECVVYDDELEHRGRGKRRLPLLEALEECPDRYASVYMAGRQPGVGIRQVRFGRTAVWLRQASKVGDWRSNIEDEETVIEVRRGLGPSPVPRVLWAIDFVPSAAGLLAVDFNTAPQLETLGEVGALEIEEIARELERAAAEHPEHLAQP
jgi:hypothetical protein